MHVCMCASETSVAWKPLITFPSKFGTMILGIFCYSGKSSLKGIMKPILFLVFPGNNLE